MGYCRKPYCCSMKPHIVDLGDHFNRCAKACSSMLETSFATRCNEDSRTAITPPQEILACSLLIANDDVALPNSRCKLLLRNGSYWRKIWTI
jgi:hypothetical protein